MIDYENQLRKFFKITKAVHISPQAQTLYFQLISYFDSKFWPQSLKLDNITIYHSTELSRQALARARKELQKLALISYTPGTGSASGEYVVFDLSQKSVKDLITDEKFLYNQPDAEIANLSQFYDEFEYFRGRPFLCRIHLANFAKGAKKSTDWRV